MLLCELLKYDFISDATVIAVRDYEDPHLLSTATRRPVIEELEPLLLKVDVKAFRYDFLYDNLKVYVKRFPACCRDVFYNDR